MVRSFYLRGSSTGAVKRPAVGRSGRIAHRF
jgi:hypothetical protein